MHIKEILNKYKLNSVIENFFSLTSLQLLTYLFPLITLPYVTKIIGLANFGIIAFAGSLNAYFVTIVDYGFSLTATREIAQNIQDHAKLEKTYNKVLFTKVFILILLSAFYFPLILSIQKFSVNKTVFLFSYLLVVNNVFYPQWFFQGIEKMRYLTILGLITNTLYLASIFIFIKKKEDFVLLPALIGISTLISGIASMIVIYYRFNIKFRKVKFNEIKETLKSGFSIFISQLLPNLYNNTTTFILGVFASESSIGLYAAARKIVYFGNPLINIITRSFFPNISKTKNNFFILKKVLLVTSGLLTGFFILFANFFLHLLFPPNFYPASHLIYVIAVSFFFLGVYHTFGTSYLIPNGYDKKLMKITVIVSIIGFVLAIVLIFFFKEFGAAFTLLITRFLMGISTYILYRRLRIIKNNI